LKINRPQEEYDELMVLQRKEKDARVKQRMLAILAQWDKTPVGLIASQQRVSRRTVVRWVSRFNEEGIAGLYERAKSGCPRKVDYEQLYQDLLQSPEEFGYPVQGWNYKLVRDHLKNHYGVTYHPGSIAYILRQLKIRSVKPRPRSYRTSEEQIETWKKT
jgi:transposase